MCTKNTLPKTISLKQFLADIIVIFPYKQLFFINNHYYPVK